MVAETTPPKENTTGASAVAILATGAGVVALGMGAVAGVVMNENAARAVGAVGVEVAAGAAPNENTPGVTESAAAEGVASNENALEAVVVVAT